MKTLRSTYLPASVLLGLFCLCLVCNINKAWAQFPDANGPRAVPRPDLGHDYIHLLDETVSPANGSVNLKIDIPLPPGRGIMLPFSISYNSGSVFGYQDKGVSYEYNPPAAATTILNVSLEPTPSVTGHSNAGWDYSTPMLTYSYNHITYDNNWYADPNEIVECYWTTNFVFSSPDGSRHPLYLAQSASAPAEATLSGLCPGSSPRAAVDSGDFETYGHLCWSLTENCNGHQVVTPDGTIYTFPVLIDNGLQNRIATSVHDRNNNTISITAGTGATYIDELGRTVMNLVANMNSYVGSPLTDTITVSGLSNSYVVHWATVPSSGIYGHAQTLSPINIKGVSLTRQ